LTENFGDKNNRKKILKNKVEKPAREKNGSLSEKNKDLTIIIVSFGKIRKRLIKEAVEQLSNIIKINYIFSEDVLPIDKPNRIILADDEVENHIIELVHWSFEGHPRQNEMINKVRLKLKKLNKTGKIEYIKKIFIKANEKKEIIDELIERLNNITTLEQYDADILISKLGNKYKYNSAGYLAITEKDIYDDENNFLFAKSVFGRYSVLSYKRFLASFNNESPNRKRLINRIVKQMITSSFFILDIPRCTTPDCVRAYPNSLDEHDKKNMELCDECKIRFKLKAKELKKIDKKIKSK